MRLIVNLDYWRKHLKEENRDGRLMSRGDSVDVGASPDVFVIYFGIVLVAIVNFVNNWMIMVIQLIKIINH